MLRVEFETTNPVFERSKAVRVLDGAANKTRPKVYKCGGKMHV
jgi:hypothetical protein